MLHLSDLKHCASPLFATHTRRPGSVASKGFRLHQNCARLVLCLRGVDGHRRGQELAAIVPRSYCTRGIWARQEESAETGGASALNQSRTGRWAVWRERSKPAASAKPSGAGKTRFEPKAAAPGAEDVIHIPARLIKTASCSGVSVKGNFSAASRRASMCSLPIANLNTRIALRRDCS